MLDCIGEHQTFMAAAEAGIHITPARDRVVEICIPLAAIGVRKYGSRIPTLSRIERDDLLQAALEGILHAVNDYDPRHTYNGRPLQINTWLFFRIRKEIYREISDHHWTISKPSWTDRENYMNDRLSADDRALYIDEYLRAAPDPTDETERW